MAKILLVEDDKSLREIYGVRLLAEGYDIVSAGDGEEALAMAIKDRPDLIVSDVMMPKISGFDMLDILRSTTETKGIKVIMMTALSSEDQRLRGEQLGADRYLVKSQVGIEDVVRTVHEVLGDSPMATTPQNAFASPLPTAARPPAPSVSEQTNPAVAAPVAVEPVVSASTSTPEPQIAVPPTPVAQTTIPVQQPQAAAQPQQTEQPVQIPQPTPDTFTAPPVQQAPTPVSQPQSQPSGLPQPTAPFSTTRPAGLADRIIQPLERPEAGEPISNQMDKELNQTQSGFSTELAHTQVQPPTLAPQTIDFEETPRSSDTQPPAQQ